MRPLAPVYADVLFIPLVRLRVAYSISNLTCIRIFSTHGIDRMRSSLTKLSGEKKKKTMTNDRGGRCKWGVGDRGRHCIHYFSYCYLSELQEIHSCNTKIHSSAPTFASIAIYVVLCVWQGERPSKVKYISAVLVVPSRFNFNRTRMHLTIHGSTLSKRAGKNVGFPVQDTLCRMSSCGFPPPPPRSQN